jgi:histidine triad (HIT) family protein
VAGSEKGNNDCIFCKIARKEIPADIVYENSKVIAFLNISPMHAGHTLIIPKQHYVNMLDTPENVLCEIISAAKKIAAAVVKATKADGFNIGMNNFEAAGQFVMHTHLHVMPRFRKDGFKHWEGKEAPKEELKSVQAKIVKFL